MNHSTDLQLLREYAEHQSEGAFSELVRRHVDLVYSAAARMVRDAHLAEDVSQAVFVALAQNARQLLACPTLEGWLHSTTRNLAANAIRTEVRRRNRELEVALMDEIHSAGTEENWEQIAPQLDEALGELNRPERDALLLRYFKHHDFRTVGAKLGISEDAAQKRVSRAVERLRAAFSKRGIVVGTTSLCAIITANAVHAAPAGLAMTISTGALAGTAATTSALITATTETIAMTTLQKTLVAATLAVLAGAGLYEAREAAQLRDKLQKLEQKQTTLTAQIGQWQRDRDESALQVAALREDNSRLNRNTAELLRLRNEVATLRQTRPANVAGESTAGTWDARISLLKQKVDQTPALRIPELSFLTDKDWAAATRNADMSTEEGVRQALSDLRSSAKRNFLNLVRDAIRKYASAKNGAPMPSDSAQFAQFVNANPSLLPVEMTQLKPFLDGAVEDATFQRYEFLQPTKLHDNLSDILVKEIAPPVDSEFDTHHEIGLNSGGVRNVNLVADTISAAIASFSQANNGSRPGHPAQLTPYLDQPLESILVEKYWPKLVANAKQ